MKKLIGFAMFFIAIGMLFSCFIGGSLSEFFVIVCLLIGSYMLFFRC